MARKRRSFSPEFKQEAASLVLDQGYTISQAGVSLGVVETAIRRWIDQLAEERDGVTPKGEALTLEQRRIQELEARCERLEREKSILKKLPLS
jgi:transposase